MLIALILSTIPPRKGKGKDELMETPSDHESAAQRSARGFGRWLVTILALSLVSGIVEKAVSSSTGRTLRRIDEAFIAQLSVVRPFHLSEVYYHYVVSGKLPEHKPPAHYANFADEWRANSAPPAPPPNAGSIFVNIFAGPFAVLFHTWGEGAVAFLSSLFGLVFGAILLWDAEINVYAKVFFIPVTGSIIVWILWAFASVVAGALHPVFGGAAVVTTIPFAGVIGRTIVEERQHHYVGGAVGRMFGGPGEAH